MQTQTGSQALSLLLAFLIGVTSVTFSVNLNNDYGKLHIISFLDSAKYCHKIETGKFQYSPLQASDKDRSACCQNNPIAILGLTYQKVRARDQNLAREIKFPFLQKLIFPGSIRFTGLSPDRRPSNLAFSSGKLIVLFQSFLN